jgi:RNAse (barnase) inhibitor barstar
MASMEVDFAAVENSGALHDLLAESFGFPSFYGRNWNAFWDCISDPDMCKVPDTLRIKGWSTLQQRLPRDAQLFRECLEELSSSRVGFNIEWAA